MRGKKVKAIERKVRQRKSRVVAESIENTLDEPWPIRVRTGVYIASGGKMWVAKGFTWLLVLATLWNVWQILH